MNQEEILEFYSVRECEVTIYRYRSISYIKNDDMNDFYIIMGNEDLLSNKELDIKEFIDKRI